MRKREGRISFPDWCQMSHQLILVSVARVMSLVKWNKLRRAGSHCQFRPFHRQKEQFRLIRARPIRVRNPMLVVFRHHWLVWRRQFSVAVRQVPVIGLAASLVVLGAVMEANLLAMYRLDRVDARLTCRNPL